MGNDAVGALELVEAADPRVAGRVDLDVAGRVRLVPRLGDAAVAVGVDDRRAPALRCLLVAGLVVEARVQPPHRFGRTAQPERVVRVVGELQVVREVAGVDQLEVARLRVVVGDLPGLRAMLDRVVPRGRVVRSFQAPGGYVVGPHRLRDPEAPLVVQHRVVGAPALQVDRLVAPVERRHCGRGPLVRVAAPGPLDARRQVHADRLVRAGIRDHQPRPAHAVDRAVGVEERVALVGGDLVVHHPARVSPRPHAEDQVALLPLRARRDRRQLAVRDPIAPLGVELQRARPTHAVDLDRHRRVRHRRPECGTPMPRRSSRSRRGRASASRGSPGCRAGDRAGSRPSAGRPSPPASAWRRRCRCRAARYPGSRSREAPRAGSTSSWPGRSAPPRAGSAAAVAVRASSSPGRAAGVFAESVSP